GHRETERMRAASDRFDCRAIRANTKIRIWQLHRLMQVSAGDLSTAPAAPEINPAITTPLRCVDPAFEGSSAKPGEKFFLHFGHAIAVAIGEEYDVRRASHDHAAAGRDEPIGGRKICRPR